VEREIQCHPCRKCKEPIVSDQLIEDSNVERIPSRNNFLLASMRSNSKRYLKGDLQTVCKPSEWPALVESCSKQVGNLAVTISPREHAERAPGHAKAWDRQFCDLPRCNNERITRKSWLASSSSSRAAALGDFDSRRTNTLAMISNSRCYEAPMSASLLKSLRAVHFCGFQGVSEQKRFFAGGPTTVQKTASSSSERHCRSAARSET